MLKPRWGGAADGEQGAPMGRRAALTGTWRHRWEKLADGEMGVPVGEMVAPVGRSFRWGDGGAVGEKLPVGRWWRRWGDGGAGGEKVPMGSRGRRWVARRRRWGPRGAPVGSLWRRQWGVGGCDGGEFVATPSEADREPTEKVRGRPGPSQD
ncbi:hypothetical protein GUJ93_ZPchr0004g38641 [Zizania palustris]|uniref:Uncharacterized protein n=1 Tax=Zizania palustris TaxID=103762 RepID=A0A8J5VFE3_ZIZPA|nr:hypothetical protein GUJ93_ZPchr0004g38641 [Zizania palustris]